MMLMWGECEPTNRERDASILDRHSSRDKHNCYLLTLDMTVEAMSRNKSPPEFQLSVGRVVFMRTGHVTF